MALFERTGWTGAWKNGVYPHHHYHSGAHEVLGIAAGWVRVRLGGETRRTVELRAGHVVVIQPASPTRTRERARTSLSSAPIRVGRTPTCAVPASRIARALPYIAAGPAARR